MAKKTKHQKEEQHPEYSPYCLSDECKLDLIASINLDKYQKEIEDISLKKEENHYTLHGLTHIKNVIDNIRNIIKGYVDPKVKLEKRDLLLLSIATMFHDFGMDENRENHAKISAEKFLQFYNDNLFGQNLTSEEEAVNISVIIESHTSEKPKLTEDIFSKYEKIKILILLLRLGDILDITHKRLSARKLSEIPFASYLHWKKHSLINETLSFEDSVIVITAKKEVSKHEWLKEFFIREVEFIKDEFSFTKSHIGSFISRLRNIEYKFHDSSKKISKVKLAFKPYIRFEEGDYSNLYGRDDNVMNIIWNIFSENNATIIYGEKGIGKSSLIKSKVCKALSELSSDNIEYKYIENYNNVDKLVKELSEQKKKYVIIFDQFEKTLSNDDDFTWIELLNKKFNDNIRFIFSVSIGQVHKTIDLCKKIENFRYKATCINKISIEDAVMYVKKVLDSNEIAYDDKNLKEIISYLYSANESTTFNNQLNILFDYFVKNKQSIPNFEKMLAPFKGNLNILQTAIKEYHDKLFKNLSTAQKSILNQFVDRNDRIKTIEPAGNADTFEELANLQILRAINNEKTQYEFMHAQLLKVFREEYLDTKVKKLIDIEREIEDAYNKGRGIDWDCVNKIIDLNLSIFTTSEENHLLLYVIRELVKNKKYDTSISEKYNINIEDFLKILYELLSEAKEVSSTYKQYCFLVREIYKNSWSNLLADYRKKGDGITYREITNSIFLLDLNTIEHPVFNDSIDRLYYIKDEVRDRIIELIYLNNIKRCLLKTNDTSYEPYKEHQGKKIFQLICNGIENIDTAVVLYFSKIYSTNIKDDLNVVSYHQGNVALGDRKINFSDEMNKILFLSYFYEKSPIEIFEEDGNIIAIASTDRKIVRYQKEDIKNLIVDIKLNYRRKKKFQIENLSPGIYNSENDIGLNNLIKNIIDVEEGIISSPYTIKLKKWAQNPNLFRLDEGGTELFYYHRNYENKDNNFTKANVIENNAIIFNGNSSPILTIIIGEKDKNFEKKYKEVTSFYIYFDNKIALVSKAIDAWCYEVAKVKKTIEENPFIKQIYIIRPFDTEQDKASKFLIEKHKNKVVEENEFSEIKIFNPNYNWDETFKDIEIILTNKKEFEKNLYGYFCFENLQPKNSINIISAHSILCEERGVNHFLEPHISDKIVANDFLEAYVNTLIKICEHGESIRGFKEIVGLTIELNNSENLISQYNDDDDFYRKFEIDDYYKKQWTSNGGIVYDYIHSKFGINQIEFISELMYNSILNKKITRKGAFTFYLPESKTKDISSLFSCFITIGKDSENDNHFQLNPYFIWRSNECAFGLLLSLVNSLRWFHDCVFKELKTKIDEKQNKFSEKDKVTLSIEKYYYHGINMHIEDNSLMAEMIDKLIKRFQK